MIQARLLMVVNIWFIDMKLVFPLFLILVMPSMATNYFIDYVGGSDTANGTSTSTPFQHCPGDIAATSIALATTLVGGDTVIFKGGVSYILTAPFIIGVATPGITLKFAGANGSPITYDGNSAGTFGVGMANFTDNFSTNHIDAFCSLVGITNLVFKDLFIGPMGGGIIPSDPSCTLYSPNGLPPNKAGGITSYGFASNVVLGSCIISNLGYNGNGCPLGGGSFDANAGFHSSGCNGVTITNCQFMLMKDGIYFDNNSISANIIVSNCTFGVMSEWVLNLIHHTNCYCSNVFICNNLFTNTDQGIVGSAWSGYNAGALPHRNILFMRGDENAGVYALDRNVHDTNVNIFNNNMVDTLGYLGGSAGLWFQENSSALDVGVDCDVCAHELVVLMVTALPALVVTLAPPCAVDGEVLRAFTEMRRTSLLPTLTNTATRPPDISVVSLIVSVSEAVLLRAPKL